MPRKLKLTHHWYDPLLAIFLLVLGFMLVAQETKAHSTPLQDAMAMTEMETVAETPTMGQAIIDANTVAVEIEKERGLRIAQPESTIVEPAGNLKYVQKSAERAPALNNSDFFNDATVANTVVIISRFDPSSVANSTATLGLTKEAIRITKLKKFELATPLLCPIETTAINDVIREQVLLLEGGSVFAENIAASTNHSALATNYAR